MSEFIKLTPHLVIRKDEILGFIITGDEEEYAPNWALKLLAKSVPGGTITMDVYARDDLETAEDELNKLLLKVYVEEAEVNRTTTLYLVDPGAQKITTIKNVRSLTNLGLKEAKDLVDASGSGAMSLVGTFDNYDEAIQAARLLEGDGATCLIGS